MKARVLNGCDRLQNLEFYMPGLQVQEPFVRGACAGNGKETILLWTLARVEFCTRIAMKQVSFSASCLAEK